MLGAVIASALSLVAGAPVHCPELADWRTATATFQVPGAALGFAFLPTASEGPAIYLAPPVCVTLGELQLGRIPKDAGLAIWVLAHETGHIALNTRDENMANCYARDKLRGMMDLVFRSALPDENELRDSGARRASGSSPALRAARAFLPNAPASWICRSQ